MNFYPIFLKELLILKRRLFKRGYFLSTLFIPLLYFSAFGLGLGKRIEMGGVSYIKFLLPGLIALFSTSESFNWTAFSLSLSRLYNKSFEEYSICPISIIWIITGYALAGCLKGLFTTMMIMLVSCFFGFFPPLNPFFYAILFLNSFLFSCLGVIVGILAKSYTDVSAFSNFLIIPMTFLCGTFFPLTRFPEWIKQIIFYLPLTQSATALRDSFLEKEVTFSCFIILLLYLILFYFIAVLVVKSKR